MKKLLAAFSVLALSAVSASAADMAVKAPPAPVVIDSWTGFYAGLNGGGTWGGSRTTYDPADVGTTAFFGPCFAAGACPRDYGRNNGTSGEVGGQIGYNQQFRSIVIGVESDIEWTDLRSSTSIAQTNAGSGFVPFTGAASTKLDWFGTTRGKFGVLVQPNLLLYGTAGAAYGGISNTFASTFAVTAQNAVGSNSDTRIGWAGGAGIDWKYNSNWIFGIEYLHTEFATKSFGATGFGSAGCTAANCNYFVTDHFRTDTVRARVSYQFGGPIVAKY
jgi:outer membrane immunogenic protein